MPTRLAIVTGMSGAGKSTALRVLEDAGYFCVDNLPIPLIEKLVTLAFSGGSGKMDRVALGVDIRSGEAPAGASGSTGAAGNVRHQL